MTFVHDIENSIENAILRLHFSSENGFENTEAKIAYLVKIL